MKNTFIKSVTIIIAVIFAISCANQSQKKEEAQKPNIFFIMSDDHAYQAISAYGYGLNKTLNIDRIARTGTLL
ncbi:hypothetical protein ES707_22365 [subsurface metagenome]